MKQSTYNNIGIRLDKAKRRYVNEVVKAIEAEIPNFNWTNIGNRALAKQLASVNYEMVMRLLGLKLRKKKKQ